VVDEEPTVSLSPCGAISQSFSTQLTPLLQEQISVCPPSLPPARRATVVLRSIQMSALQGEGEGRYIDLTNLALFLLARCLYINRLNCKKVTKAVERNIWKMWSYNVIFIFRQLILGNIW
jgi:hypothetical protein